LLNNLLPSQLSLRKLMLHPQLLENSSFQNSRAVVTFLMTTAMLKSFSTIFLQSFIQLDLWRHFRGATTLSKTTLPMLTLSILARSITTLRIVTHNAEYCTAECRIFINILSVIMWNAIIQSVIMLTVVAPF
jgi:hypothetical protein